MSGRAGGTGPRVWVLAPGLSSDAPGGQPVDAGPSPEAELAAAREQVRALQELADYRGKLLDEAEWRYRELLEEPQEESGDAGGADQGAAARRDGGVTPGTALVALRTGLDGVLALPPQRGRRQGVPLAPHPAAFYTQGHAVLGLRSRGAPSRRRSAGAVVAPGPGPWDAIGCQ